MGSAIAVALVVGISVAVQVMLVGRVSRGVHPLAVSFVLQGSGLLAGLIWTASQRAWSVALSLVGNWWWIPLGALGWGIVAALGYSSARIGASVTLALVVAAQLTMGLLLDSTSGEIELGFHQPLGVLLMLGGVLLVTMK